MTSKEKEIVGELCKYATAYANGHYGIKEILKEWIDKVKPLLKD